MIKRNICVATLLVGIGVAGYCGAVAHADPAKTSDRLAAKEGASSYKVFRIADTGNQPPVSGTTGPTPGAGPAVYAAGFPGPRFPPPPPGPGALAGMLSMAETALGIRAEQLDAWRDYTDALQALMQPPAPPAPGQAPAPFAWPAGLAGKVMADAKKAETLMAAIERLKAKLTPAQLERAAQLDAMMPPPPPFGAPPMGPGGHRPPPPGIPG